MSAGIIFMWEEIHHEQVHIALLETYRLVLVQQSKLLVAGIAAAPKDRHHRVTTAGEPGNPAYVRGATPARYQRDSGETPLGPQARAPGFRLQIPWPNGPLPRRTIRAHAASPNSSASDTTSLLYPFLLPLK